MLKPHAATDGIALGVGLGVGAPLDGDGLGVGGALDGAALALGTALARGVALGADDGAALPVTGTGRIGAIGAVLLPEHPANPPVPHAARNRR